MKWRSIMVSAFLVAAPSGWTGAQSTQTRPPSDSGTSGAPEKGEAKGHMHGAQGGMGGMQAKAECTA
jgi:hypothetical protein